MRLDDLNDDEWTVIKEYFLAMKPARLSVESVIRSSIDAILWRMRTGEPWRFIPSRYGESTSIFRRFKAWSGSGRLG